MITLESGVVNPVPFDVSSPDANFSGFVHSYDETDPPQGQPGHYEHGFERRRRDAISLAFEDRVAPGLQNYRSRITLAACWGDDEATARQRNAEIYALHAAVAAYSGQTVMRFINSHPDDIRPNAHFQRDFTVEFGRIMPETGLDHGVGAVPEELRPTELNDVLLANFTVRIPVLMNRQIIARRSGKLAAKEKPLTEKEQQAHATFILARSGQVSLSPGEGLYKEARAERIETLLFGDLEAERIIRDLASHDYETGFRYDQAAGVDGRVFHPAKPFPDLSFLTTRKRQPSETSNRTVEQPPTIVADIDALLAEVTC